MNGPCATASSIRISNPLPSAPKQGRIRTEEGAERGANQADILG